MPQRSSKQHSLMGMLDVAVLDVVPVVLRRRVTTLLMLR